MVTAREAGDVLQVALNHFAACCVLLYTQEISDVRPDKYGSDHNSSIKLGPYQIQ